MKKKGLKIFVILIGVLVLIFCLINRSPKIIEKIQEQKADLTTSKSAKQVIGFYPYWNLNSINEDSFSKLTGVYYFSVGINPDGSLDKNGSGWPYLFTDSFFKLKSLVKKYNLRFGVTITNLDPNSIAQNVNNSIRRETLITQTIKLMRDQGFSDLNIDLEYTGDSDENLKQYFGVLIDDLAKRVKQEIPDSKITVDMLSDGISNPRIVDAKKISDSVDSIIIMGYDYNRLNAISAGPVAPLPEVLNSVNDYLKNVPADKLILGVPIYGYEWPTLDNLKGSFVIKSFRGPELSTYKRSLKTIKDNNIIVNFDDQSKSVWFSYYDKDSYSWRQVWFENERSLSLKTALIKQLNLEGAAIFALGYEGTESGKLLTTFDPLLN